MINLLFIIIIIFVLIYLLLSNKNYSYNQKLLLGSLIIIFFLSIYFFILSHRNKNYESFTNKEKEPDVNSDPYTNLNNKNMELKNSINFLISKLNDTIKTIRDIPKSIFNFSKDLLNLYKFIVIICKFFLKFTDKVNTCNSATNKLQELWNGSQTHREYIQMRINKNMALWDKCLVPEKFEKRFNECKEAYEDTKKFENYLKNNYPKFMNYLNKNGGPNDNVNSILNSLDMKDLLNLFNGTNMKENEKNFNKYSQDLEKIINKN